jgi:hypothetical protein
MTDKDVQRQLNQLGGDMAEARDDITELKEVTVEHRVRLENGSKVFADWDKRIAAVTPKPPSILKIAGITLALVGMGAGALWGLANQLRDRPTVQQLEQVIQKSEKHHDAVGHEEIGQIQKEQGAQRVRIEHIQTEQAAQSQKLDTVLERLPEKPRRRRPPR